MPASMRIGFFQRAHALGELAHRTRVQNGRRQALFRQLRKSLLFVTAGCFHGHQFDLMRPAKGAQFGDTLGVIGK